MEKYRAILKQQEERFTSARCADINLQQHGLLCQQLQYTDDSEVLYLAKPNWTNRFDPNRESTIGIFFALWVSPALVRQKQFAYTIHSKQLRKLPGYKLASRQFADEFRLAIKSRVAHWPGISLDFGPLTLLEGHDTCSEASFAQKVEQRVIDFIGIHNEIDRLLDAAAC